VHTLADVVQIFEDGGRELDLGDADVALLETQAVNARRAESGPSCGPRRRRFCFSEIL
jgi:hypothetical protein